MFVFCFKMKRVYLTNIFEFFLISFTQFVRVLFNICTNTQRKYWFTKINHKQNTKIALNLLEETRTNHARFSIFSTANCNHKRTKTTPQKQNCLIIVDTKERERLVLKQRTSRMRRHASNWSVASSMNFVSALESTIRINYSTRKKKDFTIIYCCYLRTPNFARTCASFALKKTNQQFI